ncbi:MAG TPA: hypothetical protein VEJ20_02465 [Candidatus Eremiobacteraceae bacterium]|nr:hypothetical protein [Candidatus Eremiobacteraceae bacterium]
MRRISPLTALGAIVFLVGVGFGIRDYLETGLQYGLIGWGIVVVIGYALMSAGQRRL